jgi:hypothetical protein
MRQKSVPEKEPATQVVKNIRRATRRHFSAVSRRTENMPLPRYRERALNALKVIATKWPALEGWSTQAKATNDLELLGVSYSVSPDDALTLLDVPLGPGPPPNKVKDHSNRRCGKSRKDDRT